MTTLPDPYKKPTITVPEAGALLGLKRAASYAAAHRGEIPTIRIGRRLVVPTAKLLTMLGVNSASGDAPSEDDRPQGQTYCIREAARRAAAEAPPLSPEQIAIIRAIFAAAPPHEQPCPHRTSKGTS